MKLTAEDVAKATKLSIATVRVYAAQKKLGTREGNRRFFTKADLEKFRSSAPSPRKSSKRKAGRPKAAKKTAAKTKPVVRQDLPSKPEPKPVRRSFWDFFMNRKPQRKIGLMELRKK